MNRINIKNGQMITSKGWPQKYKRILEYIVQFRKVENIIKKHWSILWKDKIPGLLLPLYPAFIYRKAPKLKDKLAPGVIDPPKQKKSSLFF